MKTMTEARLSRAFERTRERRGWSYTQTWKAVYALLGDAAPTSETLMQYHKGAVKQRLNLEVILALCAVYNLDLGKVAPEMLARVGTFSELATAALDGPIRSCRWTPELAQDDRESINADSTRRSA
jgi:hypothetical protein